MTSYTQENARHLDPVVPNLVHLIKFGSESLKLFVYLNFLAIMQNIKPDAVYIHQVGPQSNESAQSWAQILKHPLVQIKFLSQDIEIFGIRPHVDDYAHKADIIRYR